MTTTAIPRTEHELLAQATGLAPEKVAARLAKLSETERNVIELCAPYAGATLPEREVARRLGLRRHEVRRIHELASSKLRHPALGD